jgi:hypothetical protein
MCHSQSNAASTQPYALRPRKAAAHEPREQADDDPQPSPVINILGSSLEDTVPNRQHLPEEPDMSPNLLGPTQTQSSLPHEGESHHGDAAACRLGQFKANLSHVLSFPVRAWP